MNTIAVRTLRFAKLESGFTLVELVIAMVVAAILLAIAIPSFDRLIRNNRMASAVNGLAGAVHLARMEAVRRNKRVTVCKGSANNGCANSNGWEQGWIVFEDSNGDANYDSGEDLLREHESLPSNLAVTGNTNVADYISFVATGRAQLTSGAFQSGTIKVCDDRSGNFGRELTLIGSGRLRLTKGVSCP